MVLKFFYLLSLFVVLNESCPPGSIASFKDKTLCFVFNQTKTYFNSAEESCIDLGGHLASIHYSLDNMLIAQQAANKFSDSDVGDFWIGATDMLIQNTWTWMDGSPLNYNDWDKGQPQNTTNYDCGAVKIPSGIWISDNCGKTKPFVCSVRTLAETTKVQTTTTKATTPTKPLSCSDGWTYNNATKYCYKLMVNLNWLDAEDMCKVDGAHLVSLHSLDETLWVANFAYYPGANVDDNYKQAWIGLYTDDNNLHYQWTDGTPVNYTKWYPNRPQNQGMQSTVYFFLAPIFGDTTGAFDNWTYDKVLARAICKKPPS